MLSKSASNKKKSRNQCDWAFNFRTQFASSSDDSQSGSDSDDQELATAINGTSRLPINDLDLSTREEHVAYKPNPFSIAKINAAHRSTSTINNSALQPKTLSDKPTQIRKLTKRSCPDSGQTTIMEGFKTQAMKKLRTNAPLQRITNPLSLNSNPAFKKPVTEKLVVSVSPTKSTLSTAASALTSPCSISVANASEFPPTSSCAPEYAHILPLKASQLHDAQILSKISQSRALAPARVLPDMLRYQRKRTNDRRPVFSLFSSPGLPNGPLNYDPHILHPQPYSSPIQPVRQGPFRPYSMISLRESALEPSSPIIEIKDQSDHSEERELVEDYVVRENEDISGFLRHSPTLASSSKPLHPAKSPNQRQRAGAQPADLFPSLLLMPSTPPNRSSYPARRRIPDDSSTSFKQAKSYPERDAYQYPTGDPDDEWSTFPSRKKIKPKIAVPRNHTYTKSFHIPGLRLPPTVKAETKTVSAIRRVKMYLPPPPIAVDNSGSKRTGPSMKETEDRRHVASSPPSNLVASAYPSPSASNSKLSLSFLSPVKKARDYTPRSRRGVGAVASYRPPSPPTSDVPIPSEAMDIHQDVDLEGIQVRYPEMKRLSRKRRRLSAEVWNLLEVDSCGYVWKDVDGGRDGEEVDIKIAVWNGLPQPFA